MKNRVITMNLKVDGDGLLSYPPPPPPPPPEKAAGCQGFFGGERPVTMAAVPLFL